MRRNLGIGLVVVLVFVAVTGVAVAQTIDHDTFYACAKDGKVDADSILYGEEPICKGQKEVVSWDGSAPTPYFVSTPVITVAHVPAGEIESKTVTCPPHDPAWRAVSGSIRLGPAFMTEDVRLVESYRGQVDDWRFTLYNASAVDVAVELWVSCAFLEFDS